MRPTIFLGVIAATVGYCTNPALAGDFGACCAEFGCFMSPYPGHCGFGPFEAFYQGDGTTCDVDFCGACCLPDGSCEELTIPSTCEDQGGTFQGEATDCNNAACASALEGSICGLPAEVGPCEGIFPRFYYDVCLGQCESFVYGGCGGNANNFLTLEDCNAACPPTGDVCFLPSDVGPCDGVCPRFFFNTCTGQCELFNYGCCGGNENNFETLDECVAACPNTFAVPGSIPAVSDWGMVLMTLLLLTFGTLALRPRARATG